MYFDYNGYVLGCLNLPVQELLFSVFIIVLVWWTVFSGKVPRRSSIVAVLLTVWVLRFSCVNIGQLYHGGIYLLEETEADSVQMKGNITAVCELGVYLFPRIECDYYDNLEMGDPNGYEFTINGIQCTAPTNGTLEVGDYVEVEYLPKSGYILYIKEINEK